MNIFIKDIKENFKYVFIGNKEVLYCSGEKTFNPVDNSVRFTFRNKYGKKIVQPRVEDVEKWGGLKSNKFYKKA